MKNQQTLKEIKRLGAEIRELRDTPIPQDSFERATREGKIDGRVAFLTVLIEDLEV